MSAVSVRAYQAPAYVMERGFNPCYCPSVCPSVCRQYTALETRSDISIDALAMAAHGAVAGNATHKDYE